MIHDVDASLREILRREVVERTEVELVFEAPTSEWAARRTAPAVNVYLYDIREELRLRSAGAIAERHDGFVTGHRAPPRWFRLSYLVTAWTQRAEDEHRLLAGVLACFLRHDALPPAVLAGQLTRQDQPVMVTVAVPTASDRSVSEVWTALGGQLKPSLDLCVTAAFDTDRFSPAGPPVREPTRVRLHAVDPARPAPRLSGSGG